MSTATRPSPARGLWAVPIVLALVLLVALGVTLAHSQAHLTGTNSVPLRGPVAGVAPRLTLCQPNQLVPEHSGRMLMFVAPAHPGRVPKTSVTISTPRDGVIARAPGQYRSPGVLDVRIDPPVRRTHVDATVCIRNVGRDTVVLSGILTPFGQVRLKGKRLDIALTTLWYTPKRGSWFSQLGAIIPRVGHARIGGVWAFWVASLLLLAAFALALVTAIRENTR